MATTSFLLKRMLEINNKQFTYVSDYKNEKYLRSSFNALTQRVYGFNFEQWYQEGYWQDRYIPHSLVFEGKVVANSSVNIIDFDFLGQKRSYLQIGTVMTAPEFRGMGLSRFLMEKIMTEWKNKCDMIYLFANDSVLSFYPKFGFEKALEYQLSKEINNYPNGVIRETNMNKIDMDNNENRRLLTEKIKRSKPVSALQMIDNIGLIMFYLTSFMKENIYYISKYDIYVICEIDNDVIYLQDVFCELGIGLDEVIKKIITKDIKKVVLYFTPKNKDGFQSDLLQEENTTLFVYGNDARRFKESNIMFPLLSHA